MGGDHPPSGTARFGSLHSVYKGTSGINYNAYSFADAYLNHAKHLDYNPNTTEAPETVYFVAFKTHNKRYDDEQMTTLNRRGLGVSFCFREDLRLEAE